MQILPAVLQAAAPNRAASTSSRPSEEPRAAAEKETPVGGSTMTPLTLLVASSTAAGSQGETPKAQVLTLCWCCWPSIQQQDRQDRDARQGRTRMQVLPEVQVDSPGLCSQLSGLVIVRCLHDAAALPKRHTRAADSSNPARTSSSLAAAGGAGHAARVWHAQPGQPQGARAQQLLPEPAQEALRS